MVRIWVLVVVVSEVLSLFSALCCFFAVPAVCFLLALAWVSGFLGSSSCCFLVCLFALFGGVQVSLCFGLFGVFLFSFSSLFSLGRGFFIT